NPIGKQIQMRVEVLIFRDRLISRMKMMAPEAKDPKAFVDTLVVHGLRAQLRTGNLLTGQLYVAMDFFPTAKPATIDWTKEPREISRAAQALRALSDYLERHPEALIRGKREQKP